MSYIKDPDSRLLDCARAGYQNDLANRIECSDFEKSYFELRDYINFVDIEVSEELLVQEITEVMKQRFIPQIRSVCNMSKDGQPVKMRTSDALPGYIVTFLADHNEACVTLEEELQSTMYFIYQIGQIRLRLDDLYTVPAEKRKYELDFLKLKMQYEVLKWYPAWLRHTWIVLYGKDINFCNLFESNDANDREKFETYLITFESQGRSASVYFGEESTYNIALMPQSHVSDKLLGCKWESILGLFGDLLISAVFQYYKRIIEELAPQAAKNIKLFQEYEKIAKQNAK